MKLYDLIGSGLIIFLLTCCQDKNDLVRYNNLLVDSKHEVDSCFTDYNKKINQLITDSLYIFIPEASNSVVKYVNDKIIYINSISTPTKGEYLKKAIINYYQAISSVAESYSGYSILSDKMAKTEQIDSTRLNIAGKEENAKTTLQMLISCQKEFAKNADIKLE